ncbi:hypothetical protein [Streptomyces sp. NPDC053755]|uniref:hypothetical protein n=1 Tax=Streptomyces sp. NPDC053755 TaxID=3155815 RepID=UPI0034345635
MDVDVDEVASELYGLPPTDFTAARNAAVARAREAGDAEAARRIAGLRRPTLAAWASTLLVRHRPAETERLLQLGRALREAHRNLDGPRLKALGHRQHAVLAALARQARDLAAEAGQPVSEAVVGEIEEIVRAVVADEETAQRWSTGVLEKAPPARIGFTGLEPGPGAVPASPGGGAGARAERPRNRRREERGESQEDGSHGRRRGGGPEGEGLEAAVAAARREVARRDREVRRAEEARQAAGRRLSRAEEHLADLGRRRGEAERERDRAREDAGTAEERVREAEGAAQAAREALERLPDAR